MHLHESSKCRENSKLRFSDLDLWIKYLFIFQKEGEAVIEEGHLLEGIW